MENINIFDIALKIANKENLTAEEKRVNENAIKKAKESGVAPTSQFNFELRYLVKPNWQRTDAHYIQRKNDIDRLLQSVTFVDNCKNSMKYPYVDFTTLKWGESSTEKATVENNKVHTAKRLSARLSISKLMLLSQPSFQSAMSEMALYAIYQKLFSTIFSTAEGNDGIYNEEPKGLIDAANAVTIGGVADIMTIQKDVDKVSDSGFWVISPTAKTELNKLQLSNSIFYNNMFLNSPYISTNLAEDGYLIYVDLSKICVTEFGVAGLTVDNYTHAKDGYCDVIVECFFDFSIANSKFIKVGKFEIV